MVGDLYARDRSAQMLSSLITVKAIAPMLGPIVGGQILVIWSWQAIFWTLGIFGLMALAALFVLPETLPLSRRSPLPLSRALAGYVVLLRDPRVVGYALSGGFFFTAASSPTSPGRHSLILNIIACSRRPMACYSPS